MKKPAFTLLELLLAMSIFVTGMVSVLEIFPINRRYLAQSGDLTQATFLAQEEVETIRGVPYTNLTAGTYEALHNVGSGTAGDPLNLYQRQTVVSYVDSQNNWTTSASDLGLKRVDVTVSWTERGISRQYLLTTYVSK